VVLVGEVAQPGDELVVPEESIEGVLHAAIVRGGPPPGPTRTATVVSRTVSTSRDEFRHAATSVRT
jgi:hypothetical protein